jgi:hypothetical protein
VEHSPLKQKTQQCASSHASESECCTSRNMDSETAKELMRLLASIVDTLGFTEPASMLRDAAGLVGISADE